MSEKPDLIFSELDRENPTRPPLMDFTKGEIWRQ
jgi:hypothetical protein